MSADNKKTIKTKKKTTSRTKKQGRKKTRKNEEKNNKQQENQEKNNKNKEEQPIKKSNKNLIISIITVIIIFGILLSIPKINELKNKKNDYNHFGFEEKDGFWFLRISINDKPYQIIMHYHPRELENISIAINSTRAVGILAKYYQESDKGQIFVSMNPEATGEVAVAYVELKKILGKDFDIYNLPIRGTFSKPIQDANNTIPIITCKNRPKNALVFELKEGNETSITYPTPGCIVIQGRTAEDIVRGADRFVYTLLGVMT